MCTPFTFDPAEYEKVKRDWEDLRRRVEEMAARFDSFDAVTARLPAEDVATTGFVTRSRFAADAARASNAALRAYADAFLENLEQTAAAYTNRDDGNAQTISVIA